MPEQVSAPPAAAQLTNAMRPVAARERIEVIDILRGCAILGILLVNMPLYGWPNWGPLRAMRADLPGGLADEIASWFIWLFAEDKFYPLLSFLFGLGFSLQLLRAEGSGTHFLSVFRRRLFILLLIGLVHAFLIWSGDILARYAFVGFLLIPFRAWKPKTIIAAALVCILLPLALLPVQRELHDRSFVHVVSKDQSKQALWDQSMHAYTRGSFAEMSAERVRGVAWTVSWCIGWLQILGLFLLGLYAGRRRFFQNLSIHLPFIRKAIWWALALGVAGTLVRAGIFKLPQTRAPLVNELLQGAVDTAGFLAVSFFYAAAITLLAQRGTWKTRLLPLAAVGRMALSNYLFQSFVCTTLFYGYGFRLFAKVGPAAGLGLTFAIYAIQIPLSVWWLRRFRFGPMEWAWRSLTYGKLQPMRP
ncbi:MAG TPA: DUF418 domain-containing protein [Candidatus Angelobacter sp.]|nr:DUF418 domain-containing protein [Candidatus Angelobacter sp.]